MAKGSDAGHGKGGNWVWLGETVDPAVLEVTRRIVHAGRAEFPRAQKLEQTKLLKAEFEEVQTRHRTRKEARNAILHAADRLMKCSQAAPLDMDLAALHGVLEVLLRAASGRKGELFPRIHEFVNACDEEVGLGLIALRRTGARRGGGSNAELARKLKALVERGMRDGKGAFQRQMEEELGLPASSIMPGAATRFDIAVFLAAILKQSFDPAATLSDAAGRVYGHMPMDGSARLRDDSGRCRSDLFVEDPASTVVAAFRAFGFRNTANLFSRNRTIKSRRQKLKRRTEQPSALKAEAARAQKARTVSPAKAREKSPTKARPGSPAKARRRAKL